MALQVTWAQTHFRLAAEAAQSWRESWHNLQASVAVAWRTIGTLSGGLLKLLPVIKGRNGSELGSWIVLSWWTEHDISKKAVAPSMYWFSLNACVAWALCGISSTAWWQWNTGLCRTLMWKYCGRYSPSLDLQRRNWCQCRVFALNMGVWFRGPWPECWAMCWIYLHFWKRLGWLLATLRMKTQGDIWKQMIGCKPTQSLTKKVLVMPLCKRHMFGRIFGSCWSLPPSLLSQVIIWQKCSIKEMTMH